MIYGRVFLDNNANGVRDSGEVFSPFGQVYLDSNRNGVYDYQEPSAGITDTRRYHFNDLAPGTYRVAFETFQGHGILQPGGYNVTVHAGQSVRRTIPLSPPGLIQGVFFIDTNADGARQPGESLATKRQVIYLDLNDNGIDDPREPFAVTTPTGRYAIAEIASGQYKLRVCARARRSRRRVPIQR